MKRLLLTFLMLGFVMQVLPVKADALIVTSPSNIGQAMADEGLFLNSYTIPVVSNCMTSLCFTTKQKVGLLGIVVVAAALQAVYKIYRAAQEYPINNTEIVTGYSKKF